jgi:alkaline phosphatase
MKRSVKLFFGIAVFLFLAIPSVSRGQDSAPQAKYVFYMIGDGMGINEVVGAELYNLAVGKQPGQINFLHFPVRGFITTHSADAYVTDSAAGGTALASGVKTYNGAISVDVDKNPLPTITEWAKASGKGTGVVTSVGLNHATPSGFIAHSESRSNYEGIALEYIAAPVDFAAAAGFITKRKSGHDASFFEHKAKEAGIKVYHGKKEWENMSSSDGHVLCLSGKAETELPYAIDRGENDTSLPEFVSAGISYLESRFADEGFFVMIEGGKVDYAAHADDGVACFEEINDFAAAVDLVLEFYERYPEETLIVVTSDHETGGLLLGAGKYEMHPERLKTQKMSANKLTRLFSTTFRKEDNPAWEDAKAFLCEHLGLWGDVAVDSKAEEELKDIFERNYGSSDAKEESVTNLYSSNSLLIQTAIGYLNKAAGYLWSHTSHSGSPVGLFVKGTQAEAFASIKDNTEIAPTIAKIAGYRE